MSALLQDGFDAFCRNCVGWRILEIVPGVEVLGD